MPYYCALLYALALAALSVLSAVGTAYYALFVRAVVRSWARFAHNTLASARGGAALPALPVAPRLPAARACEPGVLRWRRWRWLQPASCWAPW